MLSGCGGAADGPPGNGRLTPLARRTSRPLASTTTGAPELLSEIAPTQFHLPAPEFGSGWELNASAVSGGDGLNSGVSIARKCVKGSASSPGAALIARRL